MGLLKFLLPKRVVAKRAAAQSALVAYAAIMQQARQPQLYGRTAAPDSFDGRFDILALHVHFVLRRVRTESKNNHSGGHLFGQALFDTFFADMDQAMREAGVGDLGVGKKIRKMAQVFYGRALAYDEALGKGKSGGGNKGTSTPDVDALKIVLARNLFPDGAGDKAAVDYLAVYALRLEDYLSAMPLADIMAGRAFPARQLLNA